MSDVQVLVLNDLYDIIPDKLFNHKDCFDSVNYGRWEQEVATPWLSKHGYTVHSWYTHEADSFGPLIRAVTLEKDGCRQEYFYG